MTTLRKVTLTYIKHMTRFQLIPPAHSQNVINNLTGHRMHKEGPQICQINPQINSSQNMYGMLKATIDHLARKIDSVQKKPQNRLFWWTLGRPNFFLISPLPK